MGLAARWIVAVVGLLLIVVAVLMTIAAVSSDGGLTTAGWIILPSLYILGGALVFIARRARGVKGRPCPRCAAAVPQGEYICPTCGFDFGTLLPPQPPSQV